MQIAKVIEIWEKIESNEPNNDDFAKLFLHRTQH